MTVGLAAAFLNSVLDAFGNATNLTAPAQVWVKLHIGDPGPAGTANAAANTTRKQASFGAASAGAIATDAAMDWTNVPNAETYSHISWWDASTGGVFLGSDDLAVSRLVAVGDNFSIPSGSQTISLSPVAA
jgi:hypothetical protein